MCVTNRKPNGEERVVKQILVGVTGGAAADDPAILAVRDCFDHEVVCEPEKTLVRLATADVWPIIATSEDTDTIRNSRKPVFLAH